MKKINCILLVDDNTADNEYHKIIIEEADVCNTIKVAMNGVEALEYIKKSGDPTVSKTDYPKPNVIFLDINMPRMNGFEFLEQYRNLDKNLKSEVVIVMLTTSLNPDDRAKAEETSEVDEFQNKPISVETLKEIAEKYFAEELPVV